MENSIPYSTNLHDDHTDFTEMIYSLSDEALQNVQDNVMGYVNYLYGDFIEENLRMDPQFSHLFGNKQNCLGNSVPLEKKECVKQNYIIQKKTPRYKIVNRTEPKKLLDEVAPKSKMITKTKKTALKNVADIKEVSGNNLGSYFLDRTKLLKSSNQECQRMNKQSSSSVIPPQTKIFQFDKKEHLNNSTVKNPTLFFIMNRPQIENHLVVKKCSDNDLHYWDLNENIQQNEIYFSNSDCNEKNLAENLSTERGITTQEEITLDVSESQNPFKKGEKNKRTYNKKNKIKLDTEESENLFFGVNNKKNIKTKPAFDVQKYLKTEELKKVERYKYNSGGHVRFCERNSKKKITELKNLDEKYKNKLLQNYIQVSDRKHITSKSSKQEVKCDKIMNVPEENHNCQNKVVVENLPINNFSVETVDEVNLGVDINSNRILPFAPGISCEQNKEDENIIIHDSNKFNSNENEQFQNEENSEKEMFSDSIQFLNSRLHFNAMEDSSQKSKISPEKLKINENDTKNMKEVQSAIKIEQEAKEEEQGLKTTGKVETKDLEEITVTENVINESINFSLISSKIKPENEKTEGYIKDEEIVKSLDSDINFNLHNNKNNTDSFCSKVMNHNVKNFDETDSNKSSDLNNENKEYNEDETISKISNESFNQEYGTQNDQYNFDAHSMNNHILESDPVVQVMPDEDANFDKSETINVEIIKNASKDSEGLINKNTDDDRIIMSKNVKSESFSRINIGHTEFENIHQPVNLISSENVEKVSAHQLKNETVTKLDKSEINIPQISIDHTDLKNMEKANKENKTPLKENIIRRTSLRNKTVLSMKNNIETQMLVKITYDKGNSRKNDLIHKEPSRSYKTEEIECSSTKISEIIEKVGNEAIKTNSSYNLRSSNAKEKKIKVLKESK